MKDDGLPHLRSSLRQGPALRIAQISPPPARPLEAPYYQQAIYPEKPRLSFWQVVFRTVPILVALVSTALLAYFVLNERSLPFAQLQQGSQPQLAQQGGGGQDVAQSGGQQEAAQQSGGQQDVAQRGGQQEVAQNGPQRFAQQPQRQSQQQVPGERLPMPSDDGLVMMILSTLVALSQANATGNYSVLREMAAPGFQEVNSAARLAQIFSDLRGRNMDLTPVLLYQPKLFRRPQMNAQGMLRITGFFPTAPEQVNFDLIFKPVQGQWRLFGIAVNTTRGRPAAAAPAAPQRAPADEAAKAARPPGEAKAKSAPPAPKPKPKASGAEATEKKPPKASGAEVTEKKPSDPDLDIRDRLDRPRPPPAAETPRKKSIWNPFGR